MVAVTEGSVDFEKIAEFLNDFEALEPIPNW